jgi:hypothetical protein
MHDPGGGDPETASKLTQCATTTTALAAVATAATTDFKFFHALGSFSSALPIAPKAPATARTMSACLCTIPVVPPHQQQI